MNTRRLDVWSPESRPTPAATLPILPLVYPGFGEIVGCGALLRRELQMGKSFSESYFWGCRGVKLGKASRYMCSSPVAQ